MFHLWCLVMDEERAPLRFMMAASSASTGVVPAIFAAKGAPSVPGQRHVAGMGRRRNEKAMPLFPLERMVSASVVFCCAILSCCVMLAV